jgi:acetylornithine deacetylase
MLAWLARLVGHPSISSAGNRRLVDELRQALSSAGGVCETFPNESGEKAALLARFGPDRPGGLMLSAHLDVVPVDGQNWTVPPFELTGQGDRLFGRGTTDMKGFVACVMAMVESLDLARLDRPLWIAFSYDEEVGCVGVRPMLAQMVARRLRPDLVIVGEPSSMQIGLGHKGKIGYRARFQGVARHSSEAPLALNALHLACDLVAGLRALQVDLERGGVRAAGYSVPYTTVHAGVLRGGQALNVVPSEAELIFETRFPASEDRVVLDARIRALASDLSHTAQGQFADAGITLSETLSYPGLSSHPDDPALGRFAGCLPVGMPTCWLSFGTEAGLFSEALKVPVVICGPGNMEQGHQPDEFIEIDQLRACSSMLDEAVARFCVGR